MKHEDCKHLELPSPKEIMTAIEVSVSQYHVRLLKKITRSLNLNMLTLMQL